MPDGALKGAVATAWLFYGLALHAHEFAHAGTGIRVPHSSSVAQRPVTSMDLLTIRKMGGVSGRGLSISPDGLRVAFEVHQADFTSNTYRVAWVVASTSSGHPYVMVGDGGDPKLFRSTNDDGTTTGTWIAEQPKWSPDGRWILYRRRIDGEVQIWTSRSDGGLQKQLTHNEADVEHFDWADDGAKLFFTVGAPRSAMRHAAKVANERGYLFDSSRPWSTLLGRTIEPRYKRTGGNPDLWVYEWHAGEERRATAAERAQYEGRNKDNGNWLDRHDVRIAARSDNSAAVAWAEPADPGRSGVAPPLVLYASPSGNESDSRRCQDPACAGMLDGVMGGYGPIEGGFFWDDSNQEVYFARHEAVGYHRTTFYAWHVRRDIIRHVYSTKDWISGCSRANERAICFRQTTTHPRTVIAIDLLTGIVDELVDVNPDFDTLILGEVRHLEFHDAHGHSFYGNLVLPTSYVVGTRYPLIFVGYRPKRTLPGGTGDEYPIHALAANGFAVFVYNVYDNYRAAATLTDWYEVSEKGWSAGLKNLSETVSMMEAAITELDQQQIVDPSRVGITGFSAGMTSAAYALINTDLFSVASVSSVQFEPIGYYLSPSGSDWKRHLRRIGFGPIGGPNDSNWQEVSLSLNVGAIAAPILINVADNEYHPAMQTAAAFVEAGKAFEMYVYPDEHHVKWYPKHRYHIYERNLDWFKFWLQCADLSNPMKREQQVRWQRMRARHMAQLKQEGRVHQLASLACSSDRSSD
jgi:dipeptidyl aminopeptidase/acylaminoacyl peptidase